MVSSVNSQLWYAVALYIYILWCDIYCIICFVVVCGMCDACVLWCVFVRCAVVWYGIVCYYVVWFVVVWMVFYLYYIVPCVVVCCDVVWCINTQYFERFKQWNMFYLGDVSVMSWRPAPFFISTFPSFWSRGGLTSSLGSVTMSVATLTSEILSGKILHNISMKTFNL